MLHCIVKYFLEISFFENYPFAVVASTLAVGLKMCSTILHLFCSRIQTETS